MFHSSIADLLGIDLRSGRPKQYGGAAAGVTIDAYMHPIELQVYGFSERIPIIAAFAEQLAPGGLLGQAGFFEQYKIEFEAYRGRLQINPRP